MAERPIPPSGARPQTGGGVWRLRLWRIRGHPCGDRRRRQGDHRRSLHPRLSACPIDLLTQPDRTHRAGDR